MKRYRIRPTVIFSGPESQYDMDFLKLARNYSYQFWRTQPVDPNTGDLGASEYVLHNMENDCDYPVGSFSKMLFAPDIIKDFSNTGTNLCIIPNSIFNNLFEEVDAGVVDDANTFEPEAEITDAEFRRMAVRCCIFMEHNVKDGNTPVKAENVSGDKGGLTKYGICQASYPNLDIANLTYDQAVAIYERDYWTDAHSDEIPRPLNALAFDLCVTSGPKNMMRVLQRAVGATDDGLWGPRTKQSAINSCSTTPKMLSAVRLFTEKRIAYYQAIVKNNSSQSKFLNGWINRAVRSQNFAQALLHTLDVL